MRFASTARDQWRQLADRLIRLRRDTGAVAAVEFALVLPVLLVLYMGTVDVTRDVMASRKLDIVSRTVSDLVAQQPTTSVTTPATISTIFTAASAIMQPYPTSSLTLTVSGVTIKTKANGNCCDATVNWSYTQSGALRSCGATLTQAAAGTVPSATTMPSSLITANQQAGYTYSSTNVSYLVIADVSYTYKPLFAKSAAWFNGPLQKTTYMVPRAVSGAITMANPVTPVNAVTDSGCSS